MKPHTRRIAAALWHQWVRNLPMESILDRLDIPYSQAIRLIASYLRERSKELDKLGPNAVTEKVIGAYEEIEAILWQQAQIYLTRMSDALSSGDEKNAMRYGQYVKDLMELLSTVITRKAEVMRRVGALPSAVERSAHLVGIVQQPASLNALTSIIPRLPTKAPTALTQPEEQKEVIDPSFDLLRDEVVE